MQVNMIVVPDMVPLDIVGPYEVLSRAAGWTVDLVACNRDPVRTDRGLSLLPTVSCHEAPPSDILAVPGGAGIDDILEDAEWLDWVRREAARSRAVMAICTGSLLLGAAGLLQGRRASCHWQARDFLPAFGATISPHRLEVDGPVYTCAGVTSGIDLALRLVGDLAGADQAQAIQLAIEYDPQPPWRSGTPETAPATVVAGVLERGRDRRAKRAALVDRAARRLSAPA